MAYLADKKPGELTALTTLATDDVFVVGDTSDASEVAKGITKANLITDLSTSFATAGHNHTGVYAPVLGADDNYVTDAEKTVIGNTSGTNTGDNAVNSNYSGLVTNATHTGDVTGATALTIAAKAVTLAKMDDVATASVFYRKTAGTGAPEVQTLATLKTDLGLSNTNSGDQTSIVGITGTKAQFDTAVTDGNFMYTGDAPTSHTHALSEVVDSTTEALGVGTIELGHASDTTISRVSAGVAAIEGVNIVTTALTGSTTQAGIAEASIASEVNTGTDAARYVSPDSLAGSNFGIRYWKFPLNGLTALTTSDKCYDRVPAGLTGMNLVSVTGSVGTGAAGSSSSGTPTFTVKNVTDGNQMLSTSLTIDAGEYTSATAAAAVAINGSFDDVVTDDLIEVAVTTAGTGVTYAVVTLGFQLP